MSKINQSRFTPYVTPDSLRKYAQLSKNLYDLHTKKNYGYEDINGSYYNGTVENWGSEMLLESRKVLLDKPSLKNIFIENTMDFYFDIQYSEYINTYDQQNMLCAVLRKDVLLSNKDYRLKFENVSKIRIPRSESWSDPIVYNNDYYLMTKTPPKLLIDFDEVELKLTDLNGGNTTYYFSLGSNTSDLYDEIDEENNVLITNPITDSMNGFPLIWICVDMLRLLPDINFQNISYNNKPLLTIGTNGHDRAMIFPMLNHDSSFFNCILKVIPAIYDGFSEDRTAPINYSSKIKEIHLLIYDNWLINPALQPLFDYCITYDDTYAKICLNDFVGCINLEDEIFENIEDSSHIQDTLRWNFKKPLPGEYGYSDKLYKNIVYAYAPLYAFYQNTLTDGKIQLTPGFVVKFDEKYLHKYEGMIENANAGIHIDITADKSNNGVDKKNGTAYSLGDFDGLPSYFKYMIDDTIHRAHVELYAIRDKLNDVNQKAIEKPTAGIIIDSGIPQNELDLSYKDLKTVIYYDWESQTKRHFGYYEENINKRNNMSEVVFVDKNTFGTSKENKYSKNKRFIYHGNRNFSLGMVGFDPDLEVGRVYVISNDKSTYENNDETDNRKDPLTFARVCDIPTSFSQLINIKGVSPTFPLDRDYVRTEASFDDIDKHMLLNLDAPRSPLRWVKPITEYLIYGDDKKYIEYPEYFKQNMNDQYPVYVNMNEKIHLNSNVYYSISSPGSGYNVDDTCLFYIGGLCLKFKITQVDNGEVTEIKFGDSDHPNLSYDEIVLSNFPERITTYDTENVISDGTDLRISCEIDEGIWNSKQQHTVNRSTHRSSQDSFCFQFDKYNNIHVLVYDYENQTFVDEEVLVGEPVYYHLYEDEDDSKTNTTEAVLLYNLIWPISNDYVYETDFSIDTVQTSLPSSESINTSEDHSVNLNEKRINVQNTLFFYNGTDTDGFHNATRCKMNIINYNQLNQEKPVGSDLNLEYYVNATNKIRFHDRIIDNVIHKEFQPLLDIFDPTLQRKYTYTDISKDIMYVANSKEILISDFISSESDIITDNVLTSNLYISNEFDDSDIDECIETYMNLSRDELISVIIEKFGNNAEPFLYENTQYQYSHDRLVNYIIENTFTWNRTSIPNTNPETVYRKPDIKLFRTIGEQVQDSVNRPVGKQPKGGFIELSSEIYDNKVNIMNSTNTTELLFVFKLDGVSNINELDNFRIYDDYGFDVSGYSILIINKTIYMYSSIDKTHGRWIPIKRNTEKEEVVL